jgi:predicted homoserine dehydrogenase-like protein
MLLAQARGLAGLTIRGVADLDPDRARVSLGRAGFAPEDLPPVTDDALALVAAEDIDVVVEATGSPSVGVEHALAAIDHGHNVVMVNVEADVLCGPALANRARAAGVVYSLAYGDQPALICELVDWARACALPIACAGKGTKHLPTYHEVTPAAVWEHYGFTAEQIATGDYNPRMFTSFLDGTKSAIEMAAVCNATGLEPQAEGLRFPPAGAHQLASVCIPERDGGVLTRTETVEVVSSLERDGSTIPDDLRFGVYVVFAAASDYVSRCFAEYGLATDPTGQYAALWRPYHLIGLEATVSVLTAGLLGAPTGCPDAFRADVVATAKDALPPGTVLDGEGGYTVYGTLIPAAAAIEANALPIGFAHGTRTTRLVEAGRRLTWADVEPPAPSAALRLRRELTPG